MGRWVEHGRYRIVVGPLGGRPHARAFLKDGPKGKIIADQDADSEEAALSAIIERLEAASEAERKARRHVVELNFDVPTPSEFVEAFIASDVFRKHGDAVTILRTLMERGAQGGTNRALARATGKTDEGWSDLVLGTLGREIANYLNIELPIPTWDEREMSSYVLATRLDRDDGGPIRRVIHPEVSEALGRL